MLGKLKIKKGFKMGNIENFTPPTEWLFQILDSSSLFACRDIMESDNEEDFKNKVKMALFINPSYYYKKNNTTYYRYDKDGYPLKTNEIKKIVDKEIKLARKDKLNFLIEND